MKIINYKHDYIEDVLRCWNSTLQYDLITKERFIETVLLDDNFQDDLMKLAIVDDHCVGFCYGVKRKFPYLERGLEPERGWISIMAVCEEYQHQGIGTKLVEEVEKALKEKGTSQITLCAYSPNYFTPGIDERYCKAIEFFTKMGYNNTSEAVSMQRDLWDYVIPEKTQKKIPCGYTLAQAISFVFSWAVWLIHCFLWEKCRQALPVWRPLTLMLLIKFISPLTIWYWLSR